MPSSPNCWHCGEALPAGVVIHARVAGADAPDVLPGLPRRGRMDRATRPGRLLRAAHVAGAKAGRGCGSGDARFLACADNARHVIRDLGDGLRESLLLIEGVRCTACVWLIERALGAHARRRQRAGQCGRATRPRHLARLAGHAAATAAGARRAPAITRCRSTRAASMTCGAASRATRSSGCWSRASAPCRP